jgi:hypothetical protein
MVADGVVGETLVNPPQAVSNNDSPAAATLGSVIGRAAVQVPISAEQARLAAELAANDQLVPRGYR